MKEYRAKLDKLILKSEEDGLLRVPELYYVPADKVRHNLWIKGLQADKVAITSELKGCKLIR